MICTAHQPAGLCLHNSCKASASGQSRCFKAASLIIMMPLRLNSQTHRHPSKGQRCTFVYLIVLPFRSMAARSQSISHARSLSQGRSLSQARSPRGAPEADLDLDGRLLTRMQSLPGSPESDDDNEGREGMLAAAAR